MSSLPHRPRHSALCFPYMPVWIGVLWLISGSAGFDRLVSAAAPPKKIVLIAGPITGHPKYTHEYEKSVILLKHLLDNSPSFSGQAVQVEAHFQGWPQDPKTLDSADTIVMLTDGGDRNVADHPLYVGDRLDQLSKQMTRGCGLVTLHWSTFHPARYHQRVTEWVGGYFDYETGPGPNKWYSAIQTWDGQAMLGVADHPIARGVRPFRVKEEFYYRLRFRDGDPRVQPILRTRPPGEVEDQTVAWAIERADGGRGFGCTGGHFYENWWNEDYRRLLLNAIVWSARIEVPVGGVVSTLDDPIRALIVTGYNHPAHDWRKVTQALIGVLEQDPRLVVHVTEQPEDLATARIVDYDLLVMNYSSWDRPGLSTAAKENFANYVSKGGGLAVIHFANGSFTDTLPNKDADWPEYRTRLVRRVWVHGPGQSGHDAYGPFRVQVTEAGRQHPITAGLAEFDTVDELYYRQQGDLPITPLLTATSKDTQQPEPLAWAYEYGQGQVFQTVLGHGDVSIRRAGALIRRGAIWAAKGTPLSFDPPLSLTENVLFREGSPWKLEESLQRAGVAALEPSQPPAAPLAAGKWNRALDAQDARAIVPGDKAWRQPPLTVECWAKVEAKEAFQILVASDTKASANHWELFTFAGSGHFTAYLPGMQPDHVRSTVDIADGQWHYLAMQYEPQRVRLFVDGRQVGEEVIAPRGAPAVSGDLAIGSLVERTLGCQGLIDEVRISAGIREIRGVPSAAWTSDSQTLGLWHFDQTTTPSTTPDSAPRPFHANLEAVKKKVASAGNPAASGGRITGHWGEDAVGFRWTEQDSVDNRFQQMDTGRFFSGTIYTLPGPQRPLSHTAKAICVRLGEAADAAVCFDTELLRMSAGWSGKFLDIDPARYGIIVPPKIAGDIHFTTPVQPGWTADGDWTDRRPFAPFGPLPREQAKYRGLYRHGDHVTFAYRVGDADVLESPWSQRLGQTRVFLRTLEIGASQKSLKMAVCGADGQALLTHRRWVDSKNNANPVDQLVTLTPPGTSPQILAIGPHDQPLVLQLAILDRRAADGINAATVVRDVTEQPSPRTWIAPGPARWTADITTQGELGTQTSEPFAVDTMTLPFDNPYRALLFVSGHDFLQPTVLAVATLHGDVWLASGIDADLDEIRWKRFATGLFQPLGLKVVNGVIHVVGRDQITRLHDLNQDGEADFYENFNNDGHVTTNGHEYVTCLETDRHGNFYYLKGDSGGKSQHDGCVLQVSPDGERLRVFATGFRNANGLGIGPHDEITAAPQEGEWTPASGIFPVQDGTFGGAMQVHHRPTPPQDFDHPLCWLPRRIDNSSGGQVWIPEGHWGPLGGQMFHLSYGQSTMMLVLREQVEGKWQGGAVPLPLRFASGVMRGRFHPADGHLYLSGLLGWVTNATRDGCLQRVRYQGKPLVAPVAIRSYANGVAVTFSDPLDKRLAEDTDQYQVEQWNYRWSSQYGSPEFKPSQPTVEGRDSVAIESASLLADGRTVFLEIPTLRAVSQWQLQCVATSTSGITRRQSVYATWHRIPSEKMDMTGLARGRGKGYLPEADRARLSPGLTVRFEQIRGGATLSDVTKRRTAALLIAPQAAPTPWLEPGPFRAQFRGLLHVSDPGEYTLLARGTGRAKVYVNDEIVAHFDSASPAPSAEHMPQPRRLSGYQSLRIEYESPMSGVAEFSLRWLTPGEDEELVSPLTLFSFQDEADLIAGETRRLGFAQVEAKRCGNCHPIPGITPQRDAPSLANAGQRLSSAWIAEWLLNPQAQRADAHMPRLLGDAADPRVRQQAADIAAFVTSETARGGGIVEKSRQKSGDQSEPKVETGAELFEDLGCIACHYRQPAKAADPFHRVSLAQVPSKYQPAALRRYLQAPAAHYRRSAMPDFRLTDEEAEQLAHYLSETPDQRPPAVSAELVGNPLAGQELVRQLRCGQCHDFGQMPAEPLLANVPLTPKMTGTTRGCLDALSANGTSHPQFAWTAEDLASVKKILTEGDSVRSPRDAAESMRHRFTQLRCGACHPRDGVASVLPEVMAEESERGVLPESLPNLTWSGERLRSDWLMKFFAGEISDRPRPHLKARMPAFPAFASELAAGLNAEHQCGQAAEESLLPLPADRLSAERWIGFRLTGKAGGLDCRQCHSVGTIGPQGDDKTRLAPGINFVTAASRLRYDFYRRFTLDPPRYDVNTRMPKLAADGRSTGVTDVHQGDARKQFDAIWVYLSTLRGTEP